MNKNADSHSTEYIDTKINRACKICKDLPRYAGMYLHHRELKKNNLQNEDEQYADLIQLKYYYALLHLLNNIHNLPECSNPERVGAASTDQKCPAPENFGCYQTMYRIYADLMSENRIKSINLKCDICAVLPYTISYDLDMVAKNIHNDDMDNVQKLELDAVITDYYLNEIGLCKQWDKCPNGVNGLEMINSVQLLSEYLKTKDRNALQMRLDVWNRVRAIDNILDTGLPTTPEDFHITDVPLHILKDKTLVYMDFGVYQLYESNEIFCEQLNNYAKKDEIQFVYSPTHMEEVCRMGNSVFENKRIENISKICNNYEVIPNNNKPLKIVTEPVDSCFARAKKLQELNRLAEVSECAKFENLEEKTRRLLGWDEKEAEKRKIKISSLKLTQLLDPKNETIDNENINRVFHELCDSYLSVEEYKDYCKTEKPFSKTREAIRILYLLMNAFGYHRNKIEKRTKFTYKALYPMYDREFYRTIRSGFYDVDHISYASKCDYFVTCDYALSLQAQEIYRYLGCKTCVIYCEKNKFLLAEIKDKF